MTDNEHILTKGFDPLVPDGDEQVRDVCRDCGFIHYINPKIVVGSIPVAPDGRLLLCRRAIEPSKGLWTIPAGFMEQGETAEAGAIREAWEEARARIATGRLLAHYSLAHISQVQLFFAANLMNAETIKPGQESLEVGLFKPVDIPWDTLAFETVKDVLSRAETEKLF